MIRTSARNLAGPVRRTLGVQSFQMIKNRINCDTGFARGIMEKYSLGEGGLPPASFVFLETGGDVREEEGRTIELLFQILRYQDYGITVAFRNMVLGLLKQNVEFRLERMKSLSGENYIKFYGIYERILKTVEAPAEGGPARGRRENKDGAGYEGEKEGAGDTLLHEIEEERRWQRELAERELVSLETEIRGDGMFLSGEAARVREFLETLPETEQEYLAQVIGTSREALMERLRMVNRREWRILEEEILSSLRRSEQFFLERQAADREQAARPEGQGYQALTDGEGPLRNGEALLKDGEVSLKEGEEPLRDGAGLEAWKSIFRQWVGFMDTEEWETVTEAVRRYRGSGETVPQAEQILRTGDKEKVMGFLAEAQSMEELYPLIDFIYRDRDLKEQFQGWLPGLEETVNRHRAFTQAETLGPADSLELRRQAAARLAGFLEEEEWLNIPANSLAGREREDREAYIGQIEKLKEEDRREVLTPAAELFLAAEDENRALDGRGFDGRVPVEDAEAGGSGAEEENLRQWKTIFATWLGALEPGEWEAVARTMDGQKSSFGGGEDFFRTGDKEKAVRHLMETESLEELYPLVEFIYEDREMRERLGRLLPAQMRPKGDGQGEEAGRPKLERQAVGRLEALLEHERTKRGRGEPFSMGLEEWKTVFSQWMNVLEREEWEAAVQAMGRRESSALKGNSVFQAEDKERAVEALGKVQSMEELYPLIDLVYEEREPGQQWDERLPAEADFPQKSYGRETDRQETKKQAKGPLAELLEYERAETRGRIGGESFSMSLEEWKTVFGRWLNVLERDEWEAVARAVGRQESFLSEGKTIFQAEDKGRVMEEVAKAESLEELYPLVEFIYEDKDISERFGEFLPAEIHPPQREYRRDTDRTEPERRAVGRLAELLEHERAESVERLRREVSLVSLGEWKEILGKWLNVLEKEEWEAVVQSTERQEGLLQGTKRQDWTESREKAMETLSAAESVEELYPLIDFIYRDGKQREQSGRMPAAQMVSVEEAYGKERDRLEKRRQAVGRLTEFLKSEKGSFPGLHERGLSGAVPEQWREALDKWQKVMEGEETEETAALETWKYRLQRWIGSLKKEEWETFAQVVRQRENVLAVGTKEILDADEQEKAAKLLADTQSMEEIRPLLGLLCGDEREHGTPGERRTDLEGYDSVKRDGLELRKQAAGRLARILKRQEEKGRSGGTAGEADEGGVSFDGEQSALRRQILRLPDSVWREVRRLTEPVLRKKVFLRQVEEGGHEEVEQALLILKEENRTYYGDARGRELAAVGHWPRDGARSVWQSLVSGKAGWKNPERGKESFMEEVERLEEPEEITGLLELFYRKEPVKSMAEGWIPGEQEAKEWYRESKEEAGRVTRQLKDNIRDWIGFLEDNQWKAVENRILEESREEKAAGLIETWKGVLGKGAGYAGTREKGDGVVEYALFRNVRFNHRSFGEKETFLGRSGQTYENRERHGVRRETGRQFFWRAAAAEEEGRKPGRGMVLLTRRGRTGAVSGDRRQPEEMPRGELWHVSAGHFPAGEDRPGEEPGREAEGFAYMPADMVMSRLGDGRHREQVKTPGADIERAVYQIKEEAVKDIQFTVRQRGNEGDGQNGQQVKELLKKFAAQQKELEELKKGQANLIRTMSADHVTDMVMKQFRDQLRIEKLRRGL